MPKRAAVCRQAPHHHRRSCAAAAGWHRRRRAGAAHYVSIGRRTAAQYFEPAQGTYRLCAAATRLIRVENSGGQCRLAVVSTDFWQAFVPTRVTSRRRARGYDALRGLAYLAAALASPFPAGRLLRRRVRVGRRAPPLCREPRVGYRGCAPDWMVRPADAPGAAHAGRERPRPLRSGLLARLLHADAATLSAGGIVAYYPTEVPLRHRSTWLGDSDPFGTLVAGCRRGCGS